MRGGSRDESYSPGPGQIDTLLWIGLVVTAIAIVAIDGALVYALRRHRAARGAQPRQPGAERRTQLRVGAVLTAFAAAILIVSLVYTEKARETPATGAAGLAAARTEPLQIQATGQQWLWRYDYPNSASPTTGSSSRSTPRSSSISSRPT